MKIVRTVGNSEIDIQDVPIPSPGPGQVLIRTVASALCGSEMHGYRKGGSSSGNSGHEAAGIIGELGAGVENLAVGQRVGASAISGCGECDYCARGQFTWCSRRSFHANMHAEYFVVPALACHPLPEDVPWGPGVLISGDGLGVPYHTSRKISGDEVKTVAVFGLGPIGLGNVLLQSYLGRTVIGIDRSVERLEFARRLGAAEVIAVEPETDVPARVRELTGGRGADVSIEAAGVPVTAKQCFPATRIAGTVIFNGEQGGLELSPSDDFIRRDITATGSWFYHHSEFPAMLALYREGLKVDALITHHFPMERAAEAYRAMQEGSTGKVILDYGVESS